MFWCYFLLVFQVISGLSTNKGKEDITFYPPKTILAFLETIAPDYERMETYTKYLFKRDTYGNDKNFL